MQCKDAQPIFFFFFLVLNPLAENYLLPVPNVIKKLVRNVRIAAIS